jgi:hypothetical protein
MQGMGVAVKMGVTKRQLDSTIGIHPTGKRSQLAFRVMSFLRRMPAMS